MITKEFNKTIELLIEQKQIMMEQLKNNNDFKIKNEIFENIFQIDSKIREYNTIIQKEEGQNYINFSNESKICYSKEEKVFNDNFQNTTKNINLNYKNDIKIEKPTEKKNNNKQPIHINLNDITIKNIIKNEGKYEISYLNQENNIESIFSFKNKSKNFYYYHCKKRPKCEGKARFNISTNEFEITKLCSNYSIHNQLDYNKFLELINNNNINYIDFSIRKNQKNLIKYILSNNSNSENIDIKKEYYKYTKIPLILNNNNISLIKTKILGKYNNLTLKDAIKKIDIPGTELECKAKDVKYNITINNKKLEREENLIIFGNKNRLLLMKNNEYNEYYIDSTFKIIPRKFNNYKLLTIATNDNTNIIKPYVFLHSYFRKFKKK